MSHWWKLTATFRNGRPEWNQPRQKQICFAKLDGEEVDIWLRKKPKGQGSQSMRYLRGVVIPDIAEACGYTDPDDYERVHQSLAWKFLRISDDPLGFPRRRSTAKHDLSQEEMTAYIDQIITHAESTIPGCRVRRPNEIEDWSKIYEHPLDEKDVA